MEGEDGKVVKRIYNMHGPLFFASAQKFVTFFNPKTDPDLIEVHFLEQGAFIDDYSAIHALNVVGEKYGKYDKQVVVRHLKFKSEKLTRKASKLIKTFSIKGDEEDEKKDVVDDDEERNSGDIMVTETKSTDVNVEVEETTSTITVVETMRKRWQQIKYIVVICQLSTMLRKYHYAFSIYLIMMVKI